MKDKNGIEIKTGHVVKVTGAYFKNDNGLYYVTHSAGDPSWYGNDYSLKKICRNGKISAAKYSLAFWPLKAFTNDRWKRAAADKWNKEQAEIEVVKIKNMSEIVTAFRKEAEDASEAAKYYGYHWGTEHPDVIRQEKIRDFYHAVIKRINAA